MDVRADDPGDEENNPFKNAFRSVPTELHSERQAMVNCSLESVRSWRILNPAVKNWLGQPTAFRFLPGTNSLPFGAKNSWWRKRAGFVDHHVWVTPFKVNLRTERN
jgi:primary-amine oxidase